MLAVTTHHCICNTILVKNTADTLRDLSRIKGACLATTTIHDLPETLNLIDLKFFANLRLDPINLYVSILVPRSALIIKSALLDGARILLYTFALRCLRIQRQTRNGNFNLCARCCVVEAALCESPTSTWDQLVQLSPVRESTLRTG